MNSTPVLIALGGFVLLRLIWWGMVGRNRPKFPPLAIAEDDPGMVEATDKARQSLDRFQQLWSADHRDCQVKVPFTTNAGEVERLWASVLELSETSLRVRYLTPPVSHVGKLDRVHDHPFADIEDWMVVAPTGEIYGGYTQRVMFQRAREQWGSLPPELEQQESQFTDWRPSP